MRDKPPWTVRTLWRGNKGETVGIEEQRVYYQHEATCRDDNYEPPNARGLRTCKDCAGIFDEKGNGVAVTSKKFD